MEDQKKDCGTQVKCRLPGREDLLVLLVLFSAVFALYWQSFGFAWTYDDFPVIVNNPDIQSFGNFLENRYPGRPLRELSFLLDHALFGLEPRWWHFQQLFWHALNGWLLYLLVRFLGGNCWVGVGTAVFFLVHPIQVEVVANISHRKDILALAFMLMAVLAYVRGCHAQRKVFWFLGAAIAWGVSLLAKENAVVIPAVLLLYEGLFLAKGQRQLLRFPFLVFGTLVVVVAGCLLYLFAGGGWDWFLTEFPRQLNKLNHPHGSIADYFRTVFKSWALMVKNFFVPQELAPEYVFTVPRRWDDLWVLSGIGCLIGWLVGLLVLWRRAPVAAFYWGWAGLLWLPTSNLWPLSYFLADRYWYAPSAGLVAVLTIVALTLLKAWPAAPKVFVGGVLLVLMLTMTWRQSGVWKNPLSLWTHAVAVSPSSSSALSHLGMTYLEEGDTQRAIDLLSKSALNFNSVTSYYNLAIAYEKMGEIRSSIRYFCFFLRSPDNVIGVDKEEVKNHLRENYGVKCD